MANNKVQLADGTVLIDLTGTTAQAGDVASGKYFYGADGTLITGTADGSSSGGSVYQDENGYIVIDDEGSSSGGYTIDDIAMRDLSATEIVLPNATYIAPYTFYGLTNITSVSAPYVTNFCCNGTASTAGSHVFYGCTSLRSVDLPSFSNPGTGGYQFYGCTSLQSIHFYTSSIGTHMFEGCTSLSTVVLEFQDSTANGGNGSGFVSCTSLVAVDWNTKRIHTTEFSGATNLAVLVLRRESSVTTLSNINAFTNTPFASGKAGGTIYVPSDLVSSYESATNWSTILGYETNQILPIEGSIYETQYADGAVVS